jgi:hypothetical protein
VSYWRKFENNIQPILDLNIPVIPGGDLSIDMLGNQYGHLEDILTRLNLDNVVWEPTRITQTSATCIDLLIRNRPNLMLDIKVSPKFCSDHCPVSVDIHIKTSKEQCYKRTIRKYDQADYNSIIHEMEGKNWSILFENKTVN